MLHEGWKSEKSACFQHFARPVDAKDVNVVMHYIPDIKVFWHLDNNYAY